MLHLDVSTMAVMISIVALTTSGALLWLTQELSFDGVKIWAAGLMVYAVALQVLTLRSVLSEPLSILLGNSLLAMTLSLMVWGVWRFLEIPTRYHLLLGPVVLMPLGSGVLLDDLAARIVLQNTLFSAQLSLMLWSLCLKRGAIPGRGGQLIFAGCSLGVSLCLMRVFWIVFWGLPTAHLLTPGPLQSVSLMGSMITVLLNSLGIIGMVKERADAHHRILALRDALTGVANRRAILGELERQLLAAHRCRKPLRLLLLDIDYFKRINDSHGHLVGDEVLKHLAQLILSQLRPTDTLGRYGGEEFLVVLPRTPPAQARVIAEYLCQHVRQTVLTLPMAQLNITTSIGMAGLVPPFEGTTEGLIHRADEALYRAKAAGRDRVMQANQAAAQTILPSGSLS